MSEYLRYKHHGREVNVRKDLKGKHREHCLCWSCEYFNPDDHEDNCSLANIIYALCVKENLVLPVWECPYFRLKGVEDEEEEVFAL